jgi:hypothetical protein
MKLPTGNARIIVIVCAIIVLGILFYYVMPGSVLQSGDQKPKGTTTVNTTPAVPLTIDASFEIQEANVSIIKYINSTPVSSEQLQMYPEFEKYMHGTNNDPAVWRQGWRNIADFEGNISRYDALVKEICKGKNIFECNRGTLIEYHNQSYIIIDEQYGTMSRNPNL